MKVESLLVYCCLLFLAPGLSGQVVVNELDTGIPDYVELRNLQGSSVAVGGWRVSTYASSAGTPLFEGTYILPAGTQIAAGGTLVLEENGSAGAPGTVGACAIRTGFNYNWMSNSSVEVILENGSGAAQDYVYRRNGGSGGAPHLPQGTSWIGEFSGVGAVASRAGDVDTDSASDWTLASPGSPCALNAGQSAPGPGGGTNVVVLALATTGVGDVTVSVTTNPPLPFAEFYNLVSTIDHAPNGTGPFFGVGIDALAVMLLPAQPSSPFHGNLDGAGQLILSFGPGALSPGTFLEAMTVIPMATGPAVTSPVVEATF